MVLLAPKLPYTHAFAGGYPRRGGQPLPSDADAIDYLERVAAADGAAVEVGVAMAVDSLVKGLKEDGLWDAIKASCLLCGPRTFNGATTALVGDDPTPYNWSNFDYNRVTGLKGDGSTTYLDSNRAGNADGQDDCHVAVFPTSITTTTSRAAGCFSGAGTADDALILNGDLRCRSIDTPTNLTVSTGSIYGYSRTSSTAFTARASATDTTGNTGGSVSPGSQSFYVFAYNNNGSSFGTTDARLAFYSIGSSLSLESLDRRISDYVAAIAAAL